MLSAIEFQLSGRRPRRRVLLGEIDGEQVWIFLAPLRRPEKVVGEPVLRRWPAWKPPKGVRVECVEEG